MANIQLPAGLIDLNVEIFSHNNQPKAIYNGVVQSVFDLPKHIYKPLYYEFLEDDDALDALEAANYTSEREMFAKYLVCRFGEFDNTPDIEVNKVNEPEYVSCNQRGTCPLEGKVCELPVINGHKLTVFEVKMIELLATEDTLVVIAEKLNVCINTLELRKKLLFRKLNVWSRARLVAVAFDFKIIKSVK